MVEIEPRIKIESFHADYANYRTYHTTSEISLLSFACFEKTSFFDFEGVGGIGKLLIEEILTLPGVVRGQIRPYELMVVKGSAFNWEDIEPEIIATLKRTFGPEAERVKIINTDGVSEWQRETSIEEPKKNLT